MGLEGILGVLDRDCSTRLREIEAGLKAELEAVLSEARRNAARVRQEAADSLVQPAERERLEVLHRAHLAALRTVEEARIDVLEAVLDRVRAVLGETRRTPGYSALLVRLIDQALADLAGSLEPDEIPRLSADPRDREIVEAYRRTLAPIPEVDYELETWGGVAALSRDGRVVVDNTLEARLEQARPPLRADLARLLETG